MWLLYVQYAAISHQFSAVRLISLAITGEKVYIVLSVTENDELCINNDEFCIKNDEFCIKNDEFCN